MPYIEQSKRDLLDNQITRLSFKIEQAADKELEGPLNYTITKMIDQLYGPIDSYQKINDVVGVLNCVLMEFYSQQARPYEEQKKQQNGDV